MPKHHFAPVEGDGVLLRLLAEKDLPATLTWRNDPEIRRWFVHSDLLTPEQHSGWFARYQDKDDDLTFIIEETAQLRRPVGQTALYRIDIVQRTCEFGRLMIGDRQAHGRGLARKAIELLIAFAFDTLGMKRVELEVFSHNHRARRLYECAGFVDVEYRGLMLAMSLDRSRHEAEQVGQCVRERAREAA